MARYVVDLPSPKARDASLCGAKAAVLARLLSAGFNVPPGFVVTTEAYDSAFRSPEQAIHPDLASEITDAFRRHSLDHAGAAVRSSATTEDLPGHSFAGQYESYLNIGSLETLLDSIRGCWTSLRSDRAAAYLEKSGIPPDAAKMAVLVQRMVPAQASGVVFTANPTNGLRSQLLANAVRGTGEAMVSGKAQPSQTVIDKRTLTAIGGGPPDFVSSEMLADLARTALRIESLFGRPQDIEFAFAEGRLFILQARPITALPEPGTPFPVIWGHPANRELLGSETVFWSNWNTRENMPYPLKPMSWSFLDDILFPAIFESMFGITGESALYRYSFIVDLVNGRAYWNMNLLLGHPFFGFIMKPIMRHIDREAGDLFEQLERKGEIRPFKPQVPFFTLARERLAAVWTWAGFPWLARIRDIQARCDAYWQRALEYDRVEMDGVPTPELLRRAREFGRDTADTAIPLMIVASKALWGTAIIERTTKRWKDLPLDDLLAGIPGNKTVEGAMDLFRLSEMPGPIRAVFESWDGNDFSELEKKLFSSEGGPEYMRRASRYFELYGHRGQKDLDMGYPSWGEDRSYVYRMVKSYLTFGPGDVTPLEQHRRARERRLGLTEEIEDRLAALSFGPLRIKIFRLGLRLAQDHFPLRENEKYYGLRCYPGSRRIVKEIGRRYHAAGLLEDPGDVFYLTVPEIEDIEMSGNRDAGRILSLTSSRKKEWNEQIDVQPPFVVRSDGIELGGEEGPGPEAGVLRGVPASSGRATGVARIIREPAEAHLFRKGEILVAPYTEPGWAPLFLLARALVMEVGGAVCHGAIVARVSGTRAGGGVRGALGAIRDGQEITVDGTKGEVRLREGSTKMLQGKKAILRRPEINDLGYIQSLWADPETMKDVGGPITLDEEGARRWYERMVDPGSPYDRYFLICTNGGTPIGEASFHRFDPEIRTAELNIKIEARHRYRGHGPEALKLLLGYFFDEFGGEEMLDPVRLENKNGARAMRSAGFERDGSRGDVVLMRISKSRFRKIHKD